MTTSASNPEFDATTQELVNQILEISTRLFQKLDGIESVTNQSPTTLAIKGKLKGQCYHFESGINVDVVLLEENEMDKDSIIQLMGNLCVKHPGIVNQLTKTMQELINYEMKQAFGGLSEDFDDSDFDESDFDDSDFMSEFEM